jgi:hypothetical protein
MVRRERTPLAPRQVSRRDLAAQEQPAVAALVEVRRSSPARQLRRGAWGARSRGGWSASVQNRQSTLYHLANRILLITRKP